MPQSSKTFGRYSLTRPPRDNDELYELVSSLWGIVIPRHKVCIEHNAPFEWFADSFFGRAPQTLVHGSRGLSGKSVAMAALGLTEAVVWGADVNLLGGSLAQSMNLHEHMRRYWDWEGAPTYMKLDESNLQILLSNKARIRPLTASQKTVRGPHPARLLLDEIDEMDYLILQGALGQPLPQKNWLGIKIPAQTAMASTWQNADGTFAQEYRRFKENELPIYTWCYRDSANPIDGWLDEETIEQKKREIPTEMWRVEYDLGEPSIGNRAFDTEAVEWMFNLPTPTEDQTIKKVKGHEEYKFKDYQRDQDYVVAADWAKAQDMTVIGVWNVTTTPIELVYYVRINRRPYPQMVGIFNRLQQEYGDCQSIHDATGLGGVIDDYIDGRAWGFLMTGRDRDDMLSEYVSAVENHMIKSPRIETHYTATKYCRVEDLYSRAQEFHLPDEVCSAALAWKAVSNNYPNVTPLGFPKSDTTWVDKQFRFNTQHLAASSSVRIEGAVTSKDELIATDWSFT
jgi:hypothetical protein